MGDQVLALKIVLPDGQIMETGGTGKASAGPDLTRLFIAGEGCFGIITEADIRVFRVPESRLLRAVEFPSFEDGFQVIVELTGMGLSPSLLDYGESYAAPGDRPETWRLYLGFEGFREEVAAQESRALRVCASCGGRDLGAGEAEEFWEHRHDIAERYAERRRTGTARVAALGGFDFIHVSIPASRVLAFREACREIITGRDLQPIELGLWCTPELFSAVLAEPDPRRGRAELAQAIDEMLSLAHDWGGSMEYCHGVGIRLAHLMEREHGAGLEVLRRAKRALDPLNIMNPGKLGL